MSIEDRPPLDPHPLSDYVAWAGRRNRDAILEQFKQLMPTDTGNVLEFASGSGMHVNYFAPHFSHLQFQPSDRDEGVFENIKQLRAEAGNANIIDPLLLDLTAPETWPREAAYHAVYCINIFQVAPASIAEGMMQCAAETLAEQGFLAIYGPFKVHGEYTTPSNEEFDRVLQSAGVEEWGLKDVAELETAAAQSGMTLQERIEMPANNFMLIFGRA